MFNPRRVATAEYAVDAIQAIVRESRFGRFVHNPQARRIHATGLFFARCAAGDVSRFFAAVDAYYRAVDRPQRWICGYELASFLTLLPAAMEQGYAHQVYWALRPARPATFRGNEKVRYRLSAPGGQEAVYAIRAEDGAERASVDYYRQKVAALQGREVVAYLDGEPVATTDYYVYEGVTRFTGFVTRPDYRRRGIASAMVQAIQQEPDVQASDCVIICCDESGPMSLYERLGFVRNNFMWVLYRRPPWTTQSRGSFT
jgi:GNAT superfamily N-acetyltransferase